MKKILTILNLFYYGAMATAMLAAALGYYLVVTQQVTIDSESDLAMKISYVVIMYVIISVPLALALFNRVVKKAKVLEDKQEQVRQYLCASILRIVFIALGFVLGILFFCLIQDQSLLFSAGISALALCFCKPTAGKVEGDLADEPESEIDEI